MNRPVWNLLKGVQTSGRKNSLHFSKVRSLSHWNQFIPVKFPFHLDATNRVYSRGLRAFLFLSIVGTPLLVNKKFRDGKVGMASCSSSVPMKKTFLLTTNEIPNGSMKEIKINDGKDSVLLVHMGNSYTCLGSKCPHYSAPLINGVLTKTHVTCPWHDAKFDIKTGECLNGPSFDDIPKYEVVVEGERIYAYLPTEIKVGQEKKVCPCKDSCERKTILIVGGGAATLGAIETLMLNGFSGKLIVCSKDSFKPYDKPVLSKSITSCKDGKELYESVKLKSDEYYENFRNLEFMHNVTVTKVDAEGKKAFLNNGTIIPYDKILITSGVSPVVSPVQENLPSNVFNLNTLSDHIRIAEQAKEGSRCAIMGSGFVACELASSLLKRNVHVTMVSKDPVPFKRVFGEKIGSIVLKALEDKKVTFYPNLHPTEYILDKGFMKLRNAPKVHGVKLSNGEVLSCDYVVEALGCIPNSDFLDKKHKDENNYIVTDKHFKVKGANDMYAAGDVCVFPYFITGEMINICHWNVAIQQGRIAAHNMINCEKKEFNVLPFFNTNVLGNNFRVSGITNDHDKVVFEGDVSKKNFVGFFVRNNQILSVVTLGNNKMAALNECLASNKVPKVYELEAGLKNSDSMINSMKL